VLDEVKIVKHVAGRVVARSERGQIVESFHELQNGRLLVYGVRDVSGLGVRRDDEHRRAGA